MDIIKLLQNNIKEFITEHKMKLEFGVSFFSNIENMPANITALQKNQY